MTTGFLYDPRFLEHDTGRGHPECAARLRATLDYLHAQPWFSRLRPIDARAAALEDVERIHQLRYLEHAQRTCQAGAPFLDSMDVAVCADSFDIALLAAGGGLALADALIAGEIDNGFALMRPPGHHAEHGEALGFCLLNNVAILARYLQKVHGLDKIAILDWDVHHGNGTQHSFEEDPSVMYVSTHQYPFYPGTGAAYETGRGRGAGTTVNCPMPAGATDADYERAFTEVILPKIDRYQPEAVLLSAGFDAHRDDPLAEINLSTGMYRWMSERVLELAEKHAEGRLLALLEGGYNLRQLPLCIAEHLQALANVD